MNRIGGTCCYQQIVNGSGSSPGQHGFDERGDKVFEHGP